MKISQIGLDQAKSKKLAGKLDLLLSNLQLMYINTRGFHWNIKGDKFFELHLKFEELYTDLQVKIDEVAERILTLGHTPSHSYTDYLKMAAIKEKKNVSDGKEGVKSILESFGILLKIERELLSLSAEADDEGTNALMSDYIRQQEKLVWMYSSFMGK
ncbi:MAG: DNA starvation/stationary phase protection protein [Chitinophagaceae bacterium]|nr:DNA starvation/stationary phase protection protein [Chitinophagaceae bacterium]MBK8951382.1 DNA starvation/stationary phase protection protein [Chitinophagaceae bacterium]